MLDALKENFIAENYKIDDQSLNHKITNGQLYLEGIAIEIQEPKAIGFMGCKEVR
jgi:hypothetical protein